MGLTCSDHLQPGSSVRREALKSPRVTTCALPFSKVLVSSGVSRFFCWRACGAMMAIYLLPLPERASPFLTTSYASREDDESALGLLSLQFPRTPLLRNPATFMATYRPPRSA